MKGYRTLLFAVLLAIAGALEQFDWVQVIPEQWSGIALAVIGVIVAWLRKITTSPLGGSDD